MAVDFCNIMENEKITAVPFGTIGPTVHDTRTNRSRSIVSVKHAAVLAVLGYIGKNTLVITPEYGNMVWLSAVLMNVELEPDKIITKNCLEDCFLCIKSCPVNALKEDNLEMNQGKCWNYAFHANEGEDFYLKCHKCRTICPNCFGTKNK
jgi:epoxyqueuosine reductase QueG